MEKSLKNAAASLAAAVLCAVLAVFVAAPSSWSDEAFAATGDPTTLQSTVVEDNDYFSITATSIQQDAEGGYVVNLSITNKTDTATLSLRAYYAAVDGVSVDTSLRAEVNAGQTVSAQFSLSADDLADLEEIGVDLQFTDISILLYAYDSNNTSLFSDEVHIYPFGESAATTCVRETQDSDVVLYDDEYVTVTLVSQGETDDGQYALNLYITNKTDAEIMPATTGDTVIVDGVEVESYYWIDVLEAGDSTLSAFRTMSYWLEDAGIYNFSDIGEVEFSFTVYDEDYNALVSTTLTTSPDVVIEVTDSVEEAAAEDEIATEDETVPEDETADAETAVVEDASEANEEESEDADDDATEDDAASASDSSSVVSVSVHQQGIGWTEGVGSGETAGSTGSDLRVEAIALTLSADVSGSISYSVDCLDYGWTEWASDGATAGTTGESEAITAIKVQLTDEVAEAYDVWYRVWVDGYGWTGWAKNGATAGTTSGDADTIIEGIEVVIQDAGSSAPGDVAPAVITSSFESDDAEVAEEAAATEEAAADEAAVSEDASTEETEEAAEAGTETDAAAAETTEESSEEEVTVAMSNALERAGAYLDFMAFSYSGLIDQLEFEGFTTEEATWAADNCGADWYEQALLSAQEYLDVLSFSREGLIDQLEYEGFTAEEAEYGVDNCGADWYEQAVLKAESYLALFSFSRDGLIDQLEFEGFTTEQAEYAADAVGL